MRCNPIKHKYISRLQDVAPVKSGDSRAMCHFGANVFGYCNGYSMQQV